MPADELAKSTTNADALKAVTVWIVDGHSQSDIAEALAAKFPKAKARPLIVAALEELRREGAEADADLIKGFCIEASRAIYRKALDVGDLACALHALKQLHALAKK